MVSQREEVRSIASDGRPLLAEIRAEFERRDPRLLAIFNAWYLDFGCDCQAKVLRARLIAKGCEWVPTERYFRTLFNCVRKVTAEMRKTG